MAEEYKSILQDQEHPRVQPVFPHDLPILLDDNALTYCGIRYKKKDLNVMLIHRCIQVWSPDSEDFSVLLCS